MGSDCSTKNHEGRQPNQHRFSAAPPDIGRVQATCRIFTGFAALGRRLHLFWRRDRPGRNERL